ncbi:TBCA-domain-containing protein [Cystobasidium minutum MCA 4210]|uniref:TBCA-domain-containing protein n=1 Tax=Cystobasidium minutum MCA 4210 TaxID=1397322 RepID=UPI0034CDA6D2|eukprot:jgi/Rhomi1/78950/CE78949_1063
MSTRQLAIKTGVVKRLLKEVTSYEKEANDALQVIERVRGTEGKDEYDIRQAEKVHAEAAKMIPDSKARLNKAAEELRELMGETESELKESEEYKNADDALAAYYELHGGELVMEAESEPKDLREDDY